MWHLVLIPCIARHCSLIKLKFIIYVLYIQTTKLRPLDIRQHKEKLSLVTFHYDTKNNISCTMKSARVEVSLDFLYVGYAIKLQS
jgi:hypothetical protein